jgi:hypothetical protein
MFLQINRALVLASLLSLSTFSSASAYEWTVTNNLTNKAGQGIPIVVCQSLSAGPTNCIQMQPNQTITYGIGGYCTNWFSIGSPNNLNTLYLEAPAAIIYDCTGGNLTISNSGPSGTAGEWLICKGAPNCPTASLSTWDEGVATIIDALDL